MGGWRSTLWSGRFTPGKVPPCPLYRKPVGLLWMYRDSLVPTGLWTLDHPACGKPLYQYKPYYHGHSPLWYDSAVFPNLHIIYTPLTSNNYCVYRWSWTSSVYLTRWAGHKSLVCTGMMEDKGTLNKTVLYLPSASRMAACKLCVVKMMIVSSSYILYNSKPVSFFPWTKILVALFLIFKWVAFCTVNNSLPEDGA